MIKQYENAKSSIEKEKRIIAEIEKVYFFLKKNKESSQVKVLNSHLKSLTDRLKKENQELASSIEKWMYSKPLVEKEEKKEEPQEEKREKLETKGGRLFTFKEISPKGLERETIKRIRKAKKEKSKEKKKKIDTSEYSKISSRFFSQISLKLLTKDSFTKMEEQLIKANMNYTPVGYISIILMSTFLSILVAGVLFLFFLFFNFSAALPIIERATEPVNLRFLKTFWILFVVPIGTFLVMYIYPSLEKKNSELSIDSELPFATISMSAISGSMVNPIKIFEIIISTDEYPALKKEFTKMINEINLYGYDLVSALKNTSKNNPSKKLSELLNGLSTTISSGGDLQNFFDERAKSLLFNYRIAQEGQAKTAETFMDIYISLLIAAPMILMLLLIIMKISGLGLTMSFLAIALMIISIVIVANIIFLTFLHLKRSK